MNTACQTHMDSPVYNQVLSLLRCGLWGEERFAYQPPQDAQWGDILKELKAHGVQLLPIELLIRENPAKSRQYLTAAAKQTMRWCEIMQVQQDLCLLLHDAGIPCAVLKGAAAASLYPQPNNRMMGDIDLLVDPARFDLACDLIAEGSEYLGDSARHKKYLRNGIIIEVHRSFSTLRDPQRKDLLNRRIWDALGSAQAVSTDRYTFYRLPMVENGLVLLEHVNIHMENGIGLRQIIDWMMFVDNVLTDGLWDADFGPFVRQLGLETFAVTVTRMCQMYLGLREDITWCATADETLCHELMEFILRQGNFGRKHESGTNRAASVISVSWNPINFFRILQYRGCKHWPVVGRNPFLRPFAWLFQLIHYIYSGLRTEHPVRFLKDSIKRSKSQASFFEALGVSCMAEEGQK